MANHGDEVYNNRNTWKRLNYRDENGKLTKDSYDCEIYLRNLPSDFKLKECFNLFKKFGRILDIRMILGIRMYNRTKGYAFVKLYDPIAAEKASSRLDGHEIRKGINIRVVLCRSQRQIIIGGIPNEVSDINVYKTLSFALNGIKAVKRMEPLEQDDRNSQKIKSDFVLAEFYTHGAAVKALRILNNERNQFWGKDLAASWSEPSELRKRVIVTEIPDDMLEHSLIDFVEVVSKNGIRWYVWHSGQVKIKFHTNYQAELVMKAINGTCLNGSVLKIRWVGSAKRS